LQSPRSIKTRTDTTSPRRKTKTTVRNEAKTKKSERKRKRNEANIKAAQIRTAIITITIGRARKRIAIPLDPRWVN
jgi:ATP-dependent helicase YprA (DUF1998 family)